MSAKSTNSTKIFICYRRSDAGGHARNLRDRLAAWFDKDDLFFDLATIGIGASLPIEIDQAIGSACVVLVLIGVDWLDELNERASAERMQRNNRDFVTRDFVQLEIEHALKRHQNEELTIIPVLFAGATMPTPALLGDSGRKSLEPLCSLNPHEFQGNDADWDNQFVRLREAIGAVKGAPRPRYRSLDRPQVFRTIENLVSLHFQDPNRLREGLHRALIGSGTRLVSPVVLHGMAGVGKTQLALAYTQTYRDHYDGAWWFRAETVEGLQLDARTLCDKIGAGIADGELPIVALKHWLQTQSAHWLLVYDNADPVLRSYLPDRGSHRILVTSRSGAWGDVAIPFEIPMWTADQGATFLAARAEKLDLQDLPKLAKLLGGLPLALEQAGGYLDASAITAQEYIDLLTQDGNLPLLLDRNRAGTGYEHTVTATLSVTFHRLSRPARELLGICAFCSPEPIPERLFTAGRQHLPADLSAASGDPLIWNEIIAELRRFGLANRVGIPAFGQTTERTASTEPAVQFHRLTQEVARNKLSRPRDAACVLKLFRAATPDEPRLPANWPKYASLMSHMLHLEGLDVAPKLPPELRVWMLNLLANYVRDGPRHYRASVKLFGRAWDVSRRTLGEEHESTLATVSGLARTYMAIGNFERARVLQESALATIRRVKGVEDQATLKAMGDLARTLRSQGELSDARALQEAVVAACRKLPGVHAVALANALNSLGKTVRAQEEFAAAELLFKEALSIYVVQLGEKHSNTLTAMSNLAAARRDQGDHVGARSLHKHSVAIRMQMSGTKDGVPIKRMRADEKTAMVTLVSKISRITWGRDDILKVRNDVEKAQATGAAQKRLRSLVTRMRDLRRRFRKRPGE